MNMEHGLIENSERLLDLTKILNLDNHNRSYDDAFFKMYPIVDDFRRLKLLICQQKKICCCYGVDNNCFDKTIFLKMQVIASCLASHFEAAAAYCLLKSQLFLGQNDFFDELVEKVEQRMKTCSSETELQRFMTTIFRIRNIYDVLL